MNYLLDKKNKERKFFKIISIIVILFFLFIFRLPILNGFSFATHALLKPILVLGNNIGEKSLKINSFLYSKKSLFAENENLKSQILESEADRANYLAVVDENIKLKEILGRKDVNKAMTLSGILSKSNQSIYGTFVIDVGTDQGIVQGKKVFAFGSVPIGSIAEVYTNSSKVLLFSNPGEKTEVIINGKNIFMQLVGRGGGNFEMILPRDFVLDIGTEVILPGITPYVVGTVQTIISDPRDSFQKALLASPVNIQELKFVEVEK